MKFRIMVGTAAVALLLGWQALAVDTQRWEIDSFEELAKGAADGVEIGSAGELAPMWVTEGETVSADGVWSLAAGSGGVYLGTGNSGKLFFEANGKIKQVAQVSAVAITRIRLDREGRPLFAAIPGGVIYRLNAKGEVEKFAETGEDYVWDFILEGSDIIAATGPHGKIVRLSAGKVKAVTETGEEHVMCLTRGGDGKLYAGTSGEGLLLEIAGDGKYRVVHDFDEKEVRSLAWVGLGDKGALVAAVNDEAGARPPAGPPGSSWQRSEPSAKEDSEDKDDESGDDKEEQPTIVIERAPAPRGGGKVSGTVYVLTEGGGVRELADLPNRAAVDMAAAGDEVFVATDQEGKVYRISPDSTDYAIAFDLAQAQALSLLADDKGLAWIGMGSPAAAVKVAKRAAQKVSYTTEVQDAGFPARWGALTWEADGEVRLFTRSGNIKDPKRGWSDWEAVGLAKPAAVKSPEARYLQIKIEWPAGSTAVVKSLSIPYRIENQSAYVDKIAVDSSEQDGDKNQAKTQRQAKPGSADDNPGAHQTMRKIAWKVTNPDKDDLEFTLFFQPEEAKQWIRIKTSDPITKPKFEWDTASLPDGWYRLKVKASDAPSNPPAEAIETSLVSERFLIDNRAPEIKGLAIAGGKAGGKAVDTMSAVSGIEFAIDGGEWIPAGAQDGVLDSPEESFSFELPKDLTPGLHILTVRAWDRALNLGAAQKEFEK
jgi:hypothetical protein